CMKQVPDTEIKIGVKDGKLQIAEDAKYIINPFDEYAIEEALQIKEKLGEGRITVLSVGPERVKEAIRGAYALGVDEAIHLKDEAFENLDSFSTALVLKKAIEKLDFDLIICGREGADFDVGQTPIALAEMLGIPHINAVVKQELLHDKIRCKRVIEGGKEIVEAKLPALFTTAQGINEPRYPPLIGIMRAKKRPITEWGLSDVGLTSDEVDAKMEYLEFSLPPQREAGRIIEGTTEDKVKELIRVMREEIKVI
ncbi:MAG: electron transfer flavoprotein subunit beta/FixA family protein, partial [Candidatus Methanofastidiosia archaeon]